MLQGGPEGPGLPEHPDAHVPGSIPGVVAFRQGGVGDGVVPVKGTEGGGPHSRHQAGGEGPGLQSLQRVEEPLAPLTLRKTFRKQQRGDLPGDAHIAVHQRPGRIHRLQLLPGGRQGVTLVLKRERLVYHVGQTHPQGLGPNADVAQTVQNRVGFVQQKGVAVLAHELHHQGADRFVHELVTAGEGEADGPIEARLLHSGDPAADEPLSQKHAKSGRRGGILRCVSRQGDAPVLIMDVDEKLYPSAAAAVAGKEQRILVRLLHLVHPGAHKVPDLPQHGVEGKTVHGHRCYLTML